MNKNRADFGYASLFDPYYFSRQDDLLNVFKGVAICSQIEPNQLFESRGFDESDLFLTKQPGHCFTESYDLLSNMKYLGSLNNDIESVDATIDNFESSEMQDQKSETNLHSF